MFHYMVAYYSVFGILAIVGGAIGFVKAKSKASLIAGAIYGLLLIVGAVLIATGPATAGIILCLAISLMLALRFVPAFLKKRAWMPSGMMSILSVLGVAAGVAALIR